MNTWIRTTPIRRTVIVKNFCCVDMSELVMPMIVIYKNPLDFPEKYVARLFRLDKPTNVAVVKDTLREIRQIIPRNMVRLGCDFRDDPVIVETWI